MNAPSARRPTPVHGSPVRPSLAPRRGRALGPPNGARARAAQWLANSAAAEVPVPLEDAWALWEDRGRIPEWMPWIAAVEVQPDEPALSRWVLRTTQFGRDWELSWLARNLSPLRHQKIHWRSVPGSGVAAGAALEVANRGAIRFARRGAGACAVRLTIEYEVPAALAPFAGLLTPLVEGILAADMRRFAEYAAAERARRVQS